MSIPALSGFFSNNPVTNILVKAAALAVAATEASGEMISSTVQQYINGTTGTDAAQSGPDYASLAMDVAIFSLALCCVGGIFYCRGRNRNSYAQMPEPPTSDEAIDITYTTRNPNS